MFTWILIIGAVLLLASIAWTAKGMAPKGVNADHVREIKHKNVGKGDYYGGAGL